MDMVFESGKTYTHAQGLSCCFRQWRATHSHCRFLHGYSIQVTITFRSEKLDSRNWVMDFGGLKPIKEWLTDTFDHKLLVASDDPMLHKIQSLAECPGMNGSENKLADVIVVDHVGCEAFAKMIHVYVSEWIASSGDADMAHIAVQEVEVREHEGNFARYRRA